MINFDSLTLKALLQEIHTILSSGRVQKIQQPSKYELLLGIRSLGKNYKLYITVNPVYPHLSLLTQQGEEYRDIHIPQKPPMFCMLLRKHMEGTKIQAAKQPDYERILELYFDSYNDLGDRVPLVLSCELMGKYSNVILYNYDNNIIYGSAHSVGPEKSREREVAGGLPYIYPPKPKKADLLEMSEAEFVALANAIPSPMNIWLNEQFNYISLALASELCKVTGIGTERDKIIATPLDRVKSLYHLSVRTLKLENLNPSISRDKKLFSLIGLDPDVDWVRVDSVNTMVDLYFGYQIFQDKFSRLKSNLSVSIRKEMKKQKTKRTLHQKAIDSTDKAEKYRQYADILMANLHRIEAGTDTITLENFFNDNRPVDIPLDPTKTPSVNAQKYYKLYNKARSASKVSEELLQQIDNDIRYLESVEESLNLAETLMDLEQIKDELIGQDIIKAPKVQTKAEKAKMALSEFVSSDNLKIYIGRNNRQNDYLISKLASPNDIWMHTQNIPGSHVLIKLPQENIEVPETTLHEAANLAAYYSQAQSSSNVPVIYTRRKFLKKPPGAKPGYVTYSQEKTLAVNPSEASVKKLLG